MGKGSGTGVYGAWKSSYKSTSGSMGSASKLHNVPWQKNKKVKGEKGERDYTYKGRGLGWETRNEGENGLMG